MISGCIITDSVENDTAKTICTLSLFKVVDIGFRNTKFKF